MRIPAIAASGMRAATTRLEAAAANFANVSTEGHRPLRAVDRASREGGVTTTLERAAVVEDQSGSVELATETVQRLLARRAFSANVAVMRTADEMGENPLRRDGA